MTKHGWALAAVILLPAAAGRAHGGEGGASTVEAERESNRKAYEAAVYGLLREHADEWVVIAEGKVAAVGSSVEAVAGAAPKALHRYLFRVGDDGDGELHANFWYGPRFGGLALARALGIETLGGGRNEETPFPRTAVRVASPGGASEPMDVLIGTVGPPLLLTIDDSERLGLARCEVPGFLRLPGQWVPFPFRRVTVRVSLPGKEGGAWVSAAVPTGTRGQMADLSRGRDFDWFQEFGGVWNMDPWASRKKALAGKWVLFGVDRPLGDGETAEQALLSGEGKAPEAYHRFLTRLPRGEEAVYEDAAFSARAKVVLNGEEVEVRRDPKRADDVYLADEATASRLRLELAEEARCTFVVREGARLHAHAGAAWIGKKPAAGETGKLAWVVHPLPAGETVWFCEPPPPPPTIPGVPAMDR